MAVLQLHFRPRCAAVLFLLALLMMAGLAYVARCEGLGAEKAYSPFSADPDALSHLAYVADMNLMQQAWEENRLEDVTRLLAEYHNSPERHFEWYYWRRRCYANTQLLNDPPPSGVVRAACFSPDRTRLAMCDDDKIAYIWDTSTRKRLFTLQGHKGIVFCVAFSPDGKLLVTGSEDNSVKIWDTATGRLLRTIDNTGEGFYHAIYSVAFSAAGKRIATGSLDGEAKVWEVATGKELFSLPIKHSVNHVAFSPDDTQIIIGGENVTQIWNAAQQKLEFTVGQSGRSLSWPITAFSKDSARLLVSHEDESRKTYQADVWGAAAGTKLCSLPEQKAYLCSAAFSPDGTTLVTADADGAIKTFDAATGAQIQSVTAPCECVAFSPDGRRIVTAEEDGAAGLYDTTTGREVLRLKHKQFLNSAVFSKDLTEIVTVSGSDTVQFWRSDYPVQPNPPIGKTK